MAALPAGPDPGAAYMCDFSNGLQRKGQSPDHRPLIPIALPRVAAVSREARMAVDRWVAQKGYEWYVDEKTGARVVVRAWDAKRDTLYVDRHDWHEFRLGSLDWAEDFEILARDVRRLALPAYEVYSGLFTLAELLDHLPLVEDVYVLFGKVPRKRRMRRPFADADNGGDGDSDEEDEKDEEDEEDEDKENESEVRDAWDDDKENESEVRDAWDDDDDDGGDWGRIDDVDSDVDVDDVDGDAFIRLGRQTKLQWRLEFECETSESVTVEMQGRKEPRFLKWLLQDWMNDVSDRAEITEWPARLMNQREYLVEVFSAKRAVRR